jgi:hypothetical protein
VVSDVARSTSCVQYSLDCPTEEASFEDVFVPKLLMCKSISSPIKKEHLQPLKAPRPKSDAI